MRAFLALLTLAFSFQAFAVEPEERLDDPALEARAREISKELRCLVCQNQSIDDSNAPLAKDLRILVRERLAAGDSDGQVKAYIVDRYGDFVLLKPPVNAETLLLWATPALALLIALWAAARWMRNRQSPNDVLSEEEKRASDAILKRLGD